MPDRGCNSHIIEAQYPTTYRRKDAQVLSEILKKHESACLVAMKKVGISTFVRYFFYNEAVKNSHFGKTKNGNLFIYCDCNDLLEISPRAFWILMLTRFAETVAESPDIDIQLKKDIDKLFLHAISAKDPFVFYDYLRKMVETLVTRTDLFLIIFLVRFDRLESIFDKQLVINLYALYDKVKFRLSYITTSVRPLYEISPKTFSGNLPIFLHSQFIKPATKSDMKSIENFLNFTRSYAPNLTDSYTAEILKLGSGHITLTRIILIAFSQWQEIPKNRDEFIQRLLKDERIAMVCEEIWENLTEEEQWHLCGLLSKKRIGIKGENNYLLQTGIVVLKKSKADIFSPLFKEWIRKKTDNAGKQNGNGFNDFTQKEKHLFDLLQLKQNELVSREEVIAAVWPEYSTSEDLAVSDWAIDRLVSRLRKKMKIVAEGKIYRIITLRGRGYRIISER